MKQTKKASNTNTSLDEIDLEVIYAFMENGNPKDAPAEVVAYLELMDKVQGMYRRIDKYGSPEAIIKHLMVVDGFSHYKAKKVYEETLEYFYCDSHVSKKAYRNIYSDKADKLINMAMLMIKDVSDLAKAMKMVMDAYKMRQLDMEDKEDLPAEWFKAPVKLYTASAELLGLPAANRNTLKKFIDEKLPELTEKQRHRIYQEADIMPFQILPNEQEDPRKS